MKTKQRGLIGAATVAVIVATACVVGPSVASPAMAQAGGMAGLGRSDTITVSATVASIDQQTRMVTLVGPDVGSLTMKVGDQVRNLAQVKQGDRVMVRYQGSITFVLAPPGSKTPRNALTAAGARAAPGQTPAGAVGAKLVVTGTVVSVDAAAHTLQLVNPSGGEVRTVAVVTPEGQRAMPMIKPGDTITAVVSEAVAVAVEPAG